MVIHWVRPGKSWPEFWQSLSWVQGTYHHCHGSCLSLCFLGTVSTWGAPQTPHMTRFPHETICKIKCMVLGRQFADFRFCSRKVICYQHWLADRLVIFRFMILSTCYMWNITYTQKVLPEGESGVMHLRVCVPTASGNNAGQNAASSSMADQKVPFLKWAIGSACPQQFVNISLLFFLLDIVLIIIAHGQLTSMGRDNPS